MHEALRSPGQPLDPESRTFLDRRCGHNFSHVRVHADGRAADAARAIKTRAYTVGSDIFFGARAYAPGTAEGKRLIAHELAHVAQGGPPGVVRRDDPRHQKGHGGEQGMGFGYRQEKGWIFVQGPSGAGGHGITQPGFDGIAYHIDADELHILDNKALKADTARSATALTTNVLQNLDDAIAGVRAMQDLPSRIKILGHLMKARAALAAGNPLPKNVKLVITGEVGNVRRVGSRLAGLGVEFREPGTLDEPLAPVSPKAQQTQGVVDTPSPKAPAPAGEGSEPSVVVDPSLKQSGNKQPPAPKPATGPDVEPSGTGPAPKTTGPAAPQRGRFAGVGLAVGSAALSLGIGLLSSYLKARVDRRIAAAQIDRNQKKAETVINQQVDVILKMMLTNPEQALYARVYMSSAVITTYDTSSGEPTASDSSPIIDLTGVGFTFVPLDPADSDTFQVAEAGGHHSTVVRLLISEIPLETPPIENLIVYAKARKLSLEDLYLYVLNRFAGLDEKGGQQKYIDAVEHWQHILDLIGHDAPRP